MHAGVPYHRFEISRGKEARQGHRVKGWAKKDWGHLHSPLITFFAFFFLFCVSFKVHSKPGLVSWPVCKLFCLQVESGPPFQVRIFFPQLVSSLLFYFSSFPTGNMGSYFFLFLSHVHRTLEWSEREPNLRTLSANSVGTNLPAACRSIRNWHFSWYIQDESNI